MERIKIQLPKQFYFSTKIKIRITDLNYGGHVGNDSFLSLIHEAREQFLIYYGFTELNFAGAGLIMSDAAIEFKKELNYGDEVLISIAAAGFSKFGFDVFYKLELIKPDKKILCGRVKTGMLCFDYQNKKLIALPETAIKKINAK
ncbi:MAG: thioesterase family protein [Chitinophagaceae bacterium]